MATTSNTSGGAKPASRKTAARKPAARRATTRSRSTGARTTASRTSTRRSTSSATQPQTRVAQVQQLAERAVLVPVGASLVARETLVTSVRGLAGKYSTRAGLERELKRYERRGATARNRFDRQVRRTRTQFERELRQRRTTVERSLRQNRRRFEREVRSQSGVISARAAKLVSGAQELIS